MRKNEPNSTLGELMDSSPETSTRSRGPAKRGLAALGTSAVLTSAALVVAVGQVFPALSVLPSDPVQPKIVSDVTVRVAGDENLPASKAVADLIKPVPAGFGGTEVTSGPARVTPLPGTQCAESPLAPVVSATRSWASGSGESRGLELVVASYGAGIGGSVMDQVDQAACGQVSWSDVPGADAVRILDGDVSTVLIRRGDVVAAIRATGTPIPDEAVADLASRMESELPALCADISSGRGDARRNPYVAPDRFTGRLVDEKVLPDQTVPTQISEAQLPDLADVTVPDPPAFPYWPANLPAAVTKPEVPSLPTPPMDSKTIQVRTQDETGPGCGWDFTGAVAPPFDKAAADAARDRATVAARKTISEDGARYASEADAYVAAAKQFREDAVIWNNYAVQIAEIATAWGKQRSAQQTYANDLSAYNNAVNARSSFLSRQAEAKRIYDDQVLACAARMTETVTITPTLTTPSSTVTITPSTVPTPSETVTVQPTEPPVPTRTETVTAEPTAQPFAGAPMQQLTCPPIRPLILDQQPPTVPQQPTPPPDPRPESEQ